MATYPKDLYYQKSHEWTRVTGKTATIGISDFAQEELNDIVYVELPEVGDTFGQGDAFGVIESVKTASDVFIPLSCEIIEFNQDLEYTPQLVNEEPYEDGWLIKIRIIDGNEVNTLLDAATYTKMVEEETS